MKLRLPMTVRGGVSSGSLAVLARVGRRARQALTMRKRRLGR
ncbi:hypothetical protein [Mycobacterium riyadhense]|nr:hypothetical protein [Mycobacterium riyadhense]